MTHLLGHGSNEDADAKAKYQELLDDDVAEVDIERWIGEGWTLDQLLEMNREAGF